MMLTLSRDLIQYHLIWNRVILKNKSNGMMLKLNNNSSNKEQSQQQIHKDSQLMFHLVSFRKTQPFSMAPKLITLRPQVKEVSFKRMLRTFMEWIYQPQEKDLSKSKSQHWNKLKTVKASLF